MLKRMIFVFFVCLYLCPISTLDAAEDQETENKLNDLGNFLQQWAQGDESEVDELLQDLSALLTSSLFKNYVLWHMDIVERSDKTVLKWVSRC